MNPDATTSPGATLDGITPPSGQPLSLSSAASSFKPRIEGYEIDQRIGQGGMATVWRGTQLSTGRHVAIKLLTSRLGSPDARSRFEREVRLTARLQHPNIARIYDSGSHEALLYYTMELIHGEPLDEYVTSRGLEQRQIIELMRTVSLAVQHAHQHGIIHRDLKFSNVLITPDGQPHLLDFGLARALTSDEETTQFLTIEGQISGTPAFMSPEQAAGAADQIDTRTDVYSLGVMLYKLLTGRWPHDISGSHQQVVARVREQEVVSPRSISRAIDSDLEALLLKALARQADDRYPSAAEMAGDLAKYLAGEPLSAKATTIIYFLRKRMRKHLVPLTASLGVVAAIAIAALVSFSMLVATAGLCILLAVVIVAAIEIRRRRDAAIHQRIRTESLLRLAEAMNRNLDLQGLWNLILTEARGLSNADAGSLFVREGPNLRFVVAQNDTLDKRLGHGQVQKLFTSVTLPIAETSIAGHVAMTGKHVSLPDVRKVSPRLPFRHNPDSDKRNNYETRSMLAVPLIDPDRQVLGVLQLINCKDRRGNPIPFPAEIHTIILSLASHAAVALRHHSLRSQASPSKSPDPAANQSTVFQ